MAVTALMLYLVFGALGFGWRTWTHYRHTGSTGFQGIRGRFGSLEWCAGTGFITAILIGITAPLLQMTGLLDPVSVLHAMPIQTFGILLAVVGTAATVYAQLDMGESWRIGVDPNETTTLVRSGVFVVVRNPIFTGMLTFGAGIVLAAPNPLAIAGFALLLASIQLQVRVVEEPYLLRVHGNDYSRYLETVGRFLPRIEHTR